MKYLIIIFCILCFNYSYSENELQPKVIDSSAKVKNLENRINKLEKERQSYDIVKEYKDLNNIYNNGFTILIGLFGIVFPALLYFVQIKPAQDALKEAELLLKKIDDDFEKSFEEHINKSKNKSIDLAIASFENSNEQSLPTSHLVLDTYKSEKFSEIQILKLVNLLKKEDRDNHNKEFFATILTFQKSKDIENYFVNLIKNTPKDKICIWGAIYFANNNKTEYFNLIASIVINGYNLGGMISSLSYSSKSFAIQFLHNEDLANNMALSDILTFCVYMEKDEHPRISKESIVETPIWKKFKTTITSTNKPTA